MATIQVTLQPHNGLNRLVPVLSTPSQQQVRYALGLGDVPVLSEDEAQVRGLFGHAIQAPLVLDGTSWSDKVGDTYKTTVANEMLLPIAIFEVSRAKNIEVTPMEGRDVPVYEFGGRGAWQVNIKGLLIGADGKFPKEELDNLWLYTQSPKSIGISCDLLNSMGIDELVILSEKIIPMEGVENAVGFELNCAQDSPVELKLKTKV